MTKEWDPVWPIILHQYKRLNKPLNVVQTYMAETHGFNASQRAYREQFKQRGITKYRRRSANISEREFSNRTPSPTSPESDQYDQRRSRKHNSRERHRSHNSDHGHHRQCQDQHHSQQHQSGQHRRSSLPLEHLPTQYDAPDMTGYQAGPYESPNGLPSTSTAPEMTHYFDNHAASGIGSLPNSPLSNESSQSPMSPILNMSTSGAPETYMAYSHPGHPQTIEAPVQPYQYQHQQQHHQSQQQQHHQYPGQLAAPGNMTGNLYLSLPSINNLLSIENLNLGMDPITSGFENHSGLPALAPLDDGNGYQSSSQHGTWFEQGTAQDGYEGDDDYAKVKEEYGMDPTGQGFTDPRASERR